MKQQGRWDCWSALGFILMHGALRDNSRFLGAHIGPLNPDPYSDGRSLLVWRCCGVGRKTGRMVVAAAILRTEVGLMLRGLKDQSEATTVSPELRLLSERRRETGNERER